MSELHYEVMVDDGLPRRRDQRPPDDSPTIVSRLGGRWAISYVIATSVMMAAAAALATIPATRQFSAYDPSHWTVLVIFVTGSAWVTGSTSSTASCGFSGWRPTTSFERRQWTRTATSPGPEVFRSAELTAKSVVVYSTPMTRKRPELCGSRRCRFERWCPPRKAGGRPATHSQRRIVGWDRKVPARSSNRCVGLVDKSPLGHIRRHDSDRPSP
jgi:hypothetical protein